MRLEEKDKELVELRRQLYNIQHRVQTTAPESDKVELVKNTGVYLNIETVMEAKLKKTPGDTLAFIMKKLYTIRELASMVLKTPENPTKTQMPSKVFSAVKRISDNYVESQSAE